MKIRTLKILLVILIPIMMLASALFGEAPAGEESPVRIYLPRAKVVEGTAITLDDVAVVSGRRLDMCVLASAVKLGRAPFPGETLTLDRQTILSRLAAEGIEKQDVVITGADQVRLRRNAKTLRTVDLINLAEEYIRTHRPTSEVSWKLARHPRAMNLPNNSAAKLRCAWKKSVPNGHMCVVVFAVVDGKVVEKREVLFKLTYRTQRVLATAPISPGEVITPDNAKIETITVHRRPGRKWKSPFGATARRGIQAGAVITESLIARSTPTVLVQRNKTIRIKIQGDGWLITSLGTALERGRTGDVIRVRNLDSKRIIAARIDEAGDAVPLMNTQRGAR